MTENKILIYAGTTEGRRLAEFLVKREVSVHVCVATEYGESLLPEGSNLTTMDRIREVVVALLVLAMALISNTLNVVAIALRKNK